MFACIFITLKIFLLLFQLTLADKDFNCSRIYVYGMNILFPLNSDTPTLSITHYYLVTMTSYISWTLSLSPSVPNIHCSR